MNGGTALAVSNTLRLPCTRHHGQSGTMAFMLVNRSSNSKGLGCGGVRREGVQPLTEAALHWQSGTL